MPGAYPLDVRGLEELAARTWRGVEEERYGDWLLRAGGGFSGRANSALVVGDAPEPLADAVPAVARWYADRGLPPRAQLPGPPGEADTAFAAAGWTRAEDVLVLTAPLTDWPAPDVPVELSPAPDAAWLAGYRYRGAALPPAARAVLTRADDPLFASVRPASSPALAAAVARGAVEDGWLVITAVTVDGEFRRRGLARAVMAALATAGRERGAHSCLLQVSEDNEPALALYARLGFTEHHRYHYRSAPV
ncbi:Acetyltransferase (GNAT) family protein [Blastococcus aurantiacus]|uniref:Acetyltransferase (GNAT) family protein n=1 Tax=Blastococcus aurantiacus TaxID=1550231 RepID=A0A1G7JEM3_9ACTN|nr:GNAT family N-acetyltransferase [Blastococcus aurantiacus]SDF23370.1 Acetyltransferase (GNAT) family protein [Blastococcus aurantiacus]